MEPVIELTRIESTLEYGTFGVLTLQKRIQCVTLEPPNYDNMETLAAVNTLRLTIREVY